MIHYSKKYCTNWSKIHPMEHQKHPKSKMKLGRTKRWAQNLIASNLSACKLPSIQAFLPGPAWVLGSSQCFAGFLPADFIFCVLIYIHSQNRASPISLKILCQVQYYWLALWEYIWCANFCTTSWFQWVLTQVLKGDKWYNKQLSNRLQDWTFTC